MKRILVFLSFILVSQAAFAAHYQVGVAKTNITPKKHQRAEVCMGGYGAPFEKCGLTDVNDRLSSRTLAISDKDTTMIITALDAPGISKAIIEKIKRRAQRRFGLSPDHVFIAATHSHAGPDLQGVWGGASDEYENYVVRKVIRSMRRALRNQEPALIYTSTTVAPVENRRGHAVVDESVNILDIVSRHDRERIATLVNMSAHPTIIPAENTAYSAGYIHYLREAVEDELGGITVFVNGVVGDAQAVTNELRGIDIAQEYGERVGERIVDAIAHCQRVRGDLAIQTTTLTHPVTNPLILGGIQAGLIDLALNENGHVTTTFSYFNFGHDVQGVTFPGEALSRLAIPIKDSLTGDVNFFFGLTNDTLGYFLPSDEFLQIEGRTTEESASLDPFIGDAAKQTLITLIQQ